MQIIGRANENVSINTRVKFVDGGFCNRTKDIRTLTVHKDGEEAYFCSNYGNLSTQLCQSTEKYRVQQHQTCIEPNVTLCKYDMVLVLLNFNEYDEGIYNITVEFHEQNPISSINRRKMLMQQFDLLLSNGKVFSGVKIQQEKFKSP